MTTPWQVVSDEAWPDAACVVRRRIERRGHLDGINRERSIAWYREGTRLDGATRRVEYICRTRYKLPLGE